ncbi:hypothetical protein ANANG_G00200810, partial [Anguilla anguilla]
RSTRKKESEKRRGCARESEGRRARDRIHSVGLLSTELHGLQKQTSVCFVSGVFLHILEALKDRNFNSLTSAEWVEENKRLVKTDRNLFLSKISSENKA